MRLGIDLDGVVADFNRGWITRYNADFDADLSLDVVDRWDGLITPTHFSDMREFWEWASNHGDGSLFRHLDTHEGALPTLRTLATGHDIVILTTKPRWAVHDTFAWIADNKIPTREVHILWKKWSVDCDVYLDDSPQMVQGLRRHRPDKVVCRFVRPWNDPVEGVVDVASWEDFATLIQSLPAGPGVTPP